MAFQDVVEQLKDIDLSDIDWSRAGIWPLPVKVIICIFLMILILVAVNVLVIDDLRKEKERVVAKEQELRSAFEIRAHQAANLDAYRAQMKDMQVSFGALISQLPSDTEVPDLLEDIDEKGADSGLKINSIGLQKERAAEFYVELPISINVTGTYHDLGSFVSGIAGMPRIVTLHDYVLKRSKQSGLLDMQILAKTYRYKDQGK